MQHDHRPFGLKKLNQRIERAYAERYVRPHLESMGADFMILKPWHLRIHGPGISLGNQVHVVASSDRKVRLSTWRHEDGHGHISIGDYALLCPGVRIDSASAIDIGANTMIASNAYLTDADWHDLYDRVRAVGTTRPIILEDNVWIGDSAIVGKGVTIGENSIVGAGSIVTKDLPANVIAVGNPAAVLRELDATRRIVRRESLLADARGLAREMDELDRYVLHTNTLLGWLRALIAPRRGD